jgi:preprotein translocase subunit SecF
MIDLVARRKLFYVISALIALPGIISLLLPGGLRPGIDFTSGTIMTVRFDKVVAQGELRQAFADAGHPDAIVQGSGDNTYIIRTKPFEQTHGNAETQEVTASERQKIADLLSSRFGSAEILSLDHVSPLIAAEIVRYSALAVAGACLGILAYLWWAFRKVPNPGRYGACAVLALIHDALVVLGAFSILGRLFTIELDAMFITAILTVIGFSVHDTIVVFDRIRENVVRHAGESFDDIVNHSLTQTLARSMNTSLTVLLTLVALMLFGGVTMRNFVLALLIGITSGTYSSIFFASMLLTSWQHSDPFARFRRAGRSPGAAVSARA